MKDKVVLLCNQGADHQDNTDSVLPALKRTPWNKGN